MQDLNATAHRILDAAEVLTQTLGFNAFSYKDLQNEVGIKTSSIHYYFPTKHDLASVMTERYTQSFIEKLGAIETKKLSGVDRLKALSTLFNQVLSEGKLCLCGMLACDIVALPQAVHEQLRYFFDVIEKWVARAIALGQTQGDIVQSIDVKLGSAHFLAVLEGGMMIARTHQKENNFDAMMNQSIAYLTGSFKETDK